MNNFELTSITLISNNRIAGYFRDALTVEIWNLDSLTMLEKLNKENIEFIDDLNYYRYDDSVTKILEYKEELIVLYHKGFSHDSFDSEFEFEMLNNYYLCIWSLKTYQLITTIPKFSTDNKIYLINDSIISYYLDTIYKFNIDFCDTTQNFIVEPTLIINEEDYNNFRINTSMILKDDNIMFITNDNQTFVYDTKLNGLVKKTNKFNVIGKAFRNWLILQNFNQLTVYSY